MWISSTFPQFYGPPNPKIVEKLKAVREKIQPAMNDLYQRVKEYVDEREERIKSIKERR